MYLSSFGEGGLEKFKHLVKENMIDFLEPTHDGMILIKHMINTKKFVSVEVMLAVLLNSGKDLSPTVNTIGNFFTLETMLMLPKYYKNCPILFNTSFICGVKKFYKIILAEQSESSLKRNTERAFLFDILASISYNDPIVSRQALIGALLLVRKDIRQESYFWHNSPLLTIIEKQLAELDIHPEDNSTETAAFIGLKNFLEEHPDILKKALNIQGFTKFFDYKIDLSKIKENTPLDLTTDRIKSYCAIMGRLSTTENYILKTSRKDTQLLELSLPFSVLKYSNEQGFYLLAHGEGAVLGKGGWGRVKIAYYCDPQGVVNPNPVAIKIERNKDTARANKEIAFFKLAYPSQEGHLYKQGTRVGKNKTYSVFPRLPGVPLGTYLASNPQLSMTARLCIVAAVINALNNLHDQGIAHLHLKPINVLYDPEKAMASLVDFGCAKKFGETITSSDFGMADYMPPDVYKNPCTATPAMDVYSCAVLIGQIMGVPYYILISPKLEHALQAIKNKEAKLAIQTVFAQTDAIGEALYKLPTSCHQDPGFQKFVNLFNCSPFNFSGIQPFQLSFYLSNMANNNPNSRPTVQKIKLFLDELVPSIVESTSHVNLKK